MRKNKHFYRKYRAQKRVQTVKSTCSSVDRAVVSGTMCGGSIPFRCICAELGMFRRVVI